MTTLIGTRIIPTAFLLSLFLCIEFVQSFQFQALDGGAVTSSISARRPSPSSAHVRTTRNFIEHHYSPRQHPSSRSWSSCSPASTKLTSTSGVGDAGLPGQRPDGVGEEGAEQQQPSRKRDVVLTVVRRFLTRLTTLRSSTVATVQALLRKAKGTLVGTASTATLLVNCLLLGFVVKDVLPSFDVRAPSAHPSSSAVVARAPPVEVPYSRFLDYVEKRGSEVHVDNVRIESSSSSSAAAAPEGGGRILYRVLRPENAKQRAGLRRARAGTITERERELLDGMASTDAYTHLIDGRTTPDLIKLMRANGVEFRAAAAASSTAAGGAKNGNALPTLAISALAYRIYQNGSSGGGMANGSPGKLARKDTNKNGSRRTKDSDGNGGDDGTPESPFEDIEGIDDAKQSVMELVDTLRNPEKYSLVGARAPTGLLLEGPPGTGKTTLARATASMADVPLLHCSGSDFVEKYAGTGASRVRKLFARAERVKGPCIIFIDEIDALGKRRRDSGDGGSGGASDEAEQTLNALLTCMDGLDSTSSSVGGSTICVLGATNRRDVLDPALVRPGRFDRIVKVDLPDAAGRERILRVHASKLLGFVEGYGVDASRHGSLGRGCAVDLSAVAEITDGLSGAELEFVVNEAAIRAVRRVGDQLERGVERAEVNNSVYPEDFEASVTAFFKSRDKKMLMSDKPMGFAIDW